MCSPLSRICHSLFAMFTLYSVSWKLSRGSCNFLFQDLHFVYFHKFAVKIFFKKFKINNAAFLPNNYGYERI